MNIDIHIHIFTNYQTDMEAPHLPQHTSYIKLALSLPFSKFELSKSLASPSEEISYLSGTYTYCSHV
jgi:hypothetical protein